MRNRFKFSTDCFLLLSSLSSFFLSLLLLFRLLFYHCFFLIALMPTRVNPIWYLNGCFFLVYFDAYMSISFDAYASQVSWDQDELKSPFKAFSKFITQYSRYPRYLKSLKMTAGARYRGFVRDVWVPTKIIVCKLRSIPRQSLPPRAKSRTDKMVEVNTKYMQSNECVLDVMKSRGWELRR